MYPEIADIYPEITEAALRAEGAQDDLRRLVAQTVQRDGRESLEVIALAAGVSRRTVYRWLAEVGDTHGERDWSDWGVAYRAMNDAIELLLEAGCIGSFKSWVAEGCAALRTPNLGAKGHLLLTLAADLHPRALPFDERERVTLALGAEAAEFWASGRSLRQKTGRNSRE